MSRRGGKAHGHSHGGKPCHGHGGPGDDEDDHGHSHSHSHGPSHGHSHGGQPCHGHSHAPAPSHGHSHGGKPCHGHGGGSGLNSMDPQMLALLSQLVSDKLDLKNMHPQELFALQEKLAQMDIDPPLNVKHTVKCIKSLMNDEVVNDSNLRKLSHDSMVETYMRKIYELGGADAFKHVLSKVNDPKRVVLALLGIGELAINSFNKKEMNEKGYITYLYEYIKKFPKNPEVIAAGFKGIAELACDPSGHGIFHILNMNSDFHKFVLDYLVDEPCKIEVASEVQGKLFTRDFDYNVGLATTRLVIAMVNHPKIKEEYMHNPLVVERIQRLSKGSSQLAIQAMEVYKILRPENTDPHRSAKIPTAKYEKVLTVPSVVQKCYVCEKEETPDNFLKRCSACRNILYCSRECQTKDWKRHKSECNKQ